MRRAADCFAPLLRVTPEDADMQYKLAVALEHTQRGSRALGHYGKAIALYASRNDPTEAAHLYGKVREYPWIARHLDPDALITIAGFHAEREDHLEAYRTYAALANGQPGKPQSERAALNCGHLLVGPIGQPAKAVQWYDVVRKHGKVEENVQEAERAVAALRNAGTPPPAHP